MLRPYERPGTPLTNRYVGASATESNCSDAFTTPAILRREQLERAQMRRRDGERAARRERLENRAAERRALGGIGAGSQLVDEHEATRAVAPREDLAEVPQVRAEGGEARLDRLLVADVGEAVVEDAGSRLSAPTGAGMPACAIAERRPTRLEQHGLAAGVRAGEQERALAGAITRSNGTTAPPRASEQRMAADADREALVRRRECRGRTRSSSANRARA